MNFKIQGSYNGTKENSFQWQIYYKFNRNDISQINDIETLDMRILKYTVGTII